MLRRESNSRRFDSRSGRAGGGSEELGFVLAGRSLTWAGQIWEHLRAAVVTQQDSEPDTMRYLCTRVWSLSPRARNQGQRQRACSPLLPGGSQLCVGPVSTRGVRRTALCSSSAFLYPFVVGLFFGGLFLFFFSPVFLSFFWVNKWPPPSPDLPPSLALSCHHFFRGPVFFGPSLSHVNSLALLLGFFLGLNLDLSPLSCRFYPSLSSCTCSCCW